MARRKNTKFIDPRYFMDEKKEELQEMRAFDPTQELGAQGLSRDETLYYEPGMEGEEFSPGTRVRYKDNTDLIGTVQRLESEEPYIGSPGKYNKFYRVLWDRTEAYIYARGSDSPRGPSKGSGQATTTDERLLIRDEGV